MQTAQSALLTTAYCPPIVYLAQFNRFNTIYLEQWENYQKGSYRNRTYIATGNGVLSLSVPLLKGKHQRMPVREVQIDQRQPWLKIHLDSLRSAYNNAPYYADYIDYLLPIYHKKHTFLFDLNLELLQRMMRWWGIATQIELTSQYTVDTDPTILDLRSAISPKVAHVVETTLEQTYPSYPQVFDVRHGFLPNLGSLDLLFCKGPEGGMYLKETLAYNLD